MLKANEDRPTTQLVSKWGKEVLDSGFVLVPTLLLKHQKEIDLDSNEVVVLMNLLASWWEPDKKPFPRSTTIAQRMGVTTRTVQRCLSKLEKKQLISRIREQISTKKGPQIRTSYDMSGIVVAMKKLRVSVGSLTVVATEKEKPVQEFIEQA